jgi:hypothetical protein
MEKGACERIQANSLSFMYEFKQLDGETGVEAPAAYERYADHSEGMAKEIRLSAATCREDITKEKEARQKPVAEAALESGAKK